MRLFVVFSVLACGTAAEATCRQIVVAKKEVVVVAAVPVVAVPVVALYQPLYPAYGAGYDSGGTQAQLQAMQQQLQQMAQALQQLQAAPGQPQKPPDTGVAPIPPAAPEKGPQAQGNPDGRKEVASLLTAKCASCHAQGVAEKKGGNFLMFTQDSALRAFSPGEVHKILRRTKGDHGPKEPVMPMGSKELSDQEFSVLLGLLD